MLCQHPIAKTLPSIFRQHSTQTSNQSTSCSYSLSPPKRMCTKFTALQTEVSDLFQVERKKFFTSITGRKYDPGKKPTKSEKLKPSSKKTTTTEKQTENHNHHNQLHLKLTPKCHHWKTSDLKKKLRFKDT